MNLYVTRTGVRLSRLAFAAIAGLVTVVLMLTVLPGYSYAADPELTKTADESATAGDSDGDGDADRPDGTSAAITARLSKKRVEDLSRRTETTRTFFNADGTLTDEQYGAPVRVQDGEGTWEDVDYTLVEQSDGSWAPKASTVDVSIDGGGAKEAARVTFEDGQSLAVTWPDELPEPSIEGAVATYALSPSTDLLITATSRGANARIRLNEAPEETDPVFDLGLRADGVELDQTANGIKILDDNGKTVGSTSSLVAWDAAVDEAGEPKDIVPLTATLDVDSTKGDVTNHDLQLTTPEGFLDDPTTTYPVTIDPDIAALTRVRDAWVRDNDTTDRGTSSYLPVGRLSDSSSNSPAMAFLKFGTSAIEGKDVVKANLNLFQWKAATCADRKMIAYPVATAWLSSITHLNDPGIRWANGTSVNANRGTTGCASGWTSMDITAMTRAWASGEYPNEGLRLIADVPTADSYERRFCSMDPNPSSGICNTATRVPRMSVTYNLPPRTPTALKVSPATHDGTAWVTTAGKPKLSLGVSDPDGQLVRAQYEVKSGATVVTVSDSVSVASGGTVTKEFPYLTDGTYSLRFRTFDGRLASAWTTGSTLKVDKTPPPKPTVTCSGAATGTWEATRTITSTTCTVAGGSGVVGFDWASGNKPQPALVASSSGNATIGTFNVPANGVFAISLRSRDAAGNLSPVADYGFGTGNGGSITPVEGERTSSTVSVEAEAPEGATSARVEHRPVGGEPSEWATATNVRPTDSNWPWLGVVTSTGRGSDTTSKLVWDISAEDGITAPAVRETRVCFTYSGVDRCTPSREVTVVPSAFGSSFPTQDVGPGQVALFTGEFQLSESDVEVPAYSGSLSLGRSHRSLAGATSAAQGVFGPGWVAELTGPDAGVAALDVKDNSATEAAITLVDPEGSSSTYVHEDQVAEAQKTGFYIGDAETETDNDVLELTSSAGTKYLTLHEQDDTKTTWKFSGGEWLVEKIDEAGATGTTTFSHDADGLVTGIFAPAPSGVTCNVSTQTAGCRALFLSYSGTASNKRLSQVDLRIWDPKPTASGLPGTGAGMVTVPVQKYAYNTNGTLKEAWDPRLGDGVAALKTAYDYSKIGTKTVLTQVTPPGQTPWRFAFETSGAEAGMFKTAMRAQVAPLTGDATWTVVYGTALHGTGLPDLRQDATETWGQKAAPVSAATVFGPDAPDTSDPTYGSISYWDVEGRTTNTAVYGAGDWQIDSSAYDAQGNEVWALDEGNRNTALTAGGDRAAVANSLATLTIYNEELPGVPAGTRIEQSWGPSRNVVLKDGTEVVGRSLSTTVYDDESAAESVPSPGRPSADALEPAMNLPVEERSGTVDATGAVYDVSKTRMRYDPVEPTDGNGWALGAPTRTTVAYGTDAESTALNRFDGEGKTIETRTAQGVATINGTASDARSTKTVYYTADNSAAEADCRNTPQWAGLECLITTGDETVPRTRSRGFDYLLNETRTEEMAAGGVSGSMTRVSTSRYDSAGRLTANGSATEGAPASDLAIPDVSYTYSDSSGVLIATTAGAETQAISHDAWGRVLTQTDGTGNTSATTYDAADRVKTFHDGKGTYTYTYDGTDAAGKIERRGLITKLKVGLASGPDEFNVAADADGTNYLTTYPNGVRATKTIDAVGDEVGLSYANATGTEFASFSHSLGSDSRIGRAESTGSTQSYTYDDRGRLTQVQDSTAEGCVTRRYGFSLDSNRSSLTTSGPDETGMCSTANSDVQTSSFDSADRIVSAGYSYDALGRTRTVPAMHTDQRDGGNLTVAYHDNDMVAQLSQSVPSPEGGSVIKTKNFALDPARRLSSTSNLSAGMELTRTTNHYADGSDSPAWIGRQSRPDQTASWVGTWSRNVTGPDGDLSIVEASDNTSKIQISNLRGDIVAQIPNVVGSVVGVDSWTEVTEYGLLREGVGPLGQGYGWLGSKRRSNDTVGGLTLMGVRLYNPVTGRFLSRDPIAGGNDNTYTYPVDPINKTDLDGRGMKSKVKKWVKKMLKKAKSAFKKGWNSKAAKKFAKQVVGTWYGRLMLKGCDLVKAVAAGCLGLGLIATYRHKGFKAAVKYGKEYIVGMIGAGVFAKGLVKLAGGVPKGFSKKIFEISGALHWDALDTAIKKAKKK